MAGQYDYDNKGTVLLMLDNTCPSPCYCFGNHRREACSISPETLEAVLEWVSQLKPSPPGMMYMTGNPRGLHEDVRPVLEDIAPSVVCTPMHPTEQRDAGLPFGVTQMVVFSSLADFEKGRGYIWGRSCLVHLDYEEIPRLSGVLGAKPTRDDVSTLRFRPRDLERWDRSHLNAYKKRIMELQTLQFRLEAAGTPVPWDFGLSTQCPAMKTLVTIGPDGLCYPCPAFYHAGQTYGLGAIETLDSYRIFGQRLEETCRLCHLEYCEACLFWEEGLAKGEITVCDLHRGMDTRLSQEEIIRHSDLSGYMFEGLREKNTVDLEDSVNDENKSLWASKHVDDISLKDFVEALRSIHQTAHAVMQGATEVPEEILSGYEKSVRLAPRSRKTLFSYREFSQTLEEIHRNMGAATKEATETIEDIMSQYDDTKGQSDEPAMISRKAIFFQKVRDLLLGLVKLGAAIRERPVLLRHSPFHREAASDGRAEDEMERLPLSEQEVTSIQRLYELFLGWDVLCRSVTDALRVGFTLDRRFSDVAQREMIEARRHMNRWFDQISKQHEWEVREGYEFAVGFESRLAPSYAFYERVQHRPPEHKDNGWSRIMPLDGIEKEVIERLASLQETSLATVKECLDRRLAGLDVEHDLAVAVRTLGQHVLDMKRWYHGMAREYNWPDVQVRASVDYKWIEGR